MSKIVEITNTTSNRLVLCYRMPSAAGEKANPVLEVELYPRALLQSVPFPNDEMYAEFAKQNKSLIDNGTIIIGKTNAKQAEKVSEENSEAEIKRISEKVDKNNQVLTNAVSGGKSNKKTKVDVKVEKE